MDFDKMVLNVLTQFANQIKESSYHVDRTDSFTFLTRKHIQVFVCVRGKYIGKTIRNLYNKLSDFIYPAERETHLKTANIHTNHVQSI